MKGNDNLQQPMGPSHPHSRKQHKASPFLGSDQLHGSSHEASLQLLGCSPLLPTLFYGGAYMVTSSDERNVFPAYEQLSAIYTPFMKGKLYS